jgi:hypothetical protein
MGGRLQQDFPLQKRFPDQTELQVFEVSQTAMDQLAAGLRRAGRKVVAFGKQNLEAAPGRITRNGRAVDTAADDQEIVVF